MKEQIGQAYFENNYPDYELQTSAGKLDFYVNLLDKWVPGKKAVFELGVGLGGFLQAICSRYECMGSDINDFAVETTKAQCPEAELFLGSYECIPEEHGPDAVVAWDVLEHIADVDKAVSVIHSRIREGGFLIGIVPVYDGPLGWLVRTLDKDPTHLWKLSRKDWLEKLVEHDFDVVEWGGVIRRLVMNRWYVHLTRPQVLLRRIGSAFYFVAKKQSSDNDGTCEQL